MQPFERLFRTDIGLRQKIARGVLIAGLVLVFGYFGIDKFRNYDLWIGWVPLWLDDLLGMSRKGWLFIIGAMEIITALLVILPHRKTRLIGVILMIIQLLGILSQTGWNDVAIRDIGLLTGAVALLVLL